MRFILCLFFTLFSSLSMAAIQQFTLDNGLKILVKEDHRAPVAVVMLWYQVGSADDPAGLTGLSHILEHMMFKGTPSNPSNTFSKTIANIGGQENAITSQDYTAYFEKIAKEYLPTSLNLEADRMQHLMIDASTFTQEMSVIQEERRLRLEDNPQALMQERFNATAHLLFPYQHPIIGWMNDLEHITIQDVRDWYQRHYAPNLATLVVVGDVSPTDVHALAKKAFSSLAERPAHVYKPQHEPPALGKKIVYLQTNTHIPLLMQGYTVPSVKSAEGSIDPYALELIAALLSANGTGRLEQQLIHQTQQANIAGAQYNLYLRYDTQFIIYAAPTAPNGLPLLEEKIQHILQQLKTEPISATELQNAKTQLIAQKTFERDSMLGQAMEMGLLETIGLGWKTIEQYEARLNQVTATDIQTVARRYFNETNQTKAYLTASQPKKTSS